MERFCDGPMSRSLSAPQEPLGCTSFYPITRNSPNPSSIPTLQASELGETLGTSFVGRMCFELQGEG